MTIKKERKLINKMKRSLSGKRTPQEVIAAEGFTGTGTYHSKDSIRKIPVDSSYRDGAKGKGGKTKYRRE